jgi:hypothetical protein
MKRWERVHHSPLLSVDGLVSDPSSVEQCSPQPPSNERTRGEDGLQLLWLQGA